MRKIREILRLRFDCHCSHLAIAKSIGIGETTVGDCLGRAKNANIEWPLPLDLTDDALEALLYPSTRKSKRKEELEGSELSSAVDWTYIHKELKRKHVTLLLLWEEHKRTHHQSLSYSHFCCRYRDWRGKLDVWMHQPHKAGEKLFVDYAGQTMPVLKDRTTGEIGDCQAPESRSIFSLVV